MHSSSIESSELMQPMHAMHRFGRTFEAALDLGLLPTLICRCSGDQAAPAHAGYAYIHHSTLHAFGTLTHLCHHCA